MPSKRTGFQAIFKLIRIDQDGEPREIPSFRPVSPEHATGCIYSLNHFLRKEHDSYKLNLITEVQLTLGEFKKQALNCL
jgi:hypothetical protein